MAGIIRKSTGKKTATSKKSPQSKKSPHSKKLPGAKKSPHRKVSPHSNKSPSRKKKNSSKAGTQIGTQQTRDAVYIDVEFDRGLLYLVLVNDGDLPAEQVSVEFDKPLFGANGIDVSALGVFKRLAFLAPQKRISVFLDDTQAYYAKRQRSVVKFELSWRIDGSRFTSRINHDMRAYADITYIIEQPDNRRIGHVRP